MTDQVQHTAGGRLIHYSDEPLIQTQSRQHAPAGAYKTAGLWFSVEGDDDWLAWCKAERFGLDRLRCATQVILSPTANVIRLVDATDIDIFTLDYKSEERFEYIDWLHVRKNAQGLIIAPYCWERRLSDHTTWYYGWDCASGVIWDAGAVAELRPLPPPDLTIEEIAA